MSVNRLQIIGSDGGKATIDQTLFARTGGVRFNAAQRVAYRWTRDGAAIYGATHNQYITGPEDIGRFISLEFMFNGDRMVQADEPVFVTDEHIEAVRALYPYAFGREPDVEGLLFWSAYLRGLKETDPVKRLEALMREFRASPTYESSLR